MRSLGAAEPAQRLRVRRGPVVERDVIVSAFLVRFHFESVEELRAERKNKIIKVGRTVTTVERTGDGP